MTGVSFQHDRKGTFSGNLWTENKYEQYIYGREIRLETDHKPLLYLKSLADTSLRVARWAMLIQKFSIQPRICPAN